MIPLSKELQHNHPKQSSSLVSEAAVQSGQVEDGVTQAAPIAFVPVALALSTRQDEPVKVVQQAVGGDVDVLHTHAVQVAQVVLCRGR